MRSSLLPFISPEGTGRTNHRVDERIDIYGLGTVFYSLFSGRQPFTVVEDVELVHQILAKSAPSLTEINSTIPSAIAKLVAKCMSKTPEGRYQHCQSLLADLMAVSDLLRSDSSALDGFPVGRLDELARFRIPSALFGRDRELKTLRDCLQRASKNATTETIIVG